jgi:hypothetical protein
MIPRTISASLIALVLATLGLSAGVSASELSVPLQFGFPEVARQTAAALGMDAEGQVVIERNHCNRIRLSDLTVQSQAPLALVSVAFEADLGARLFKRCIGPKNAQGRLHVSLEPGVSEQGFAVVLRFVSAELRQSDGSKRLLTRPARILAEKVVLPRLKDLRVDLARPLEAVDGLIQSFAGDEAPLLAHRSRLGSVLVGDQGVTAEILLELGEPRLGDAPEAALSDSEMIEWERVEDELDGFVSAAIMALAQATDDRSLQLDLLAALLDTRLAIARALGEEPNENVSDPIRDLFVASWDQLRPAVLELERNGDETMFPGLRLTAFMAGADAIAALDALGPEYGIEISRDGIRRLARMLLADETPVSFTPLSLAIDPLLRRLIGVADPAPVYSPPQIAQSWLDWLIPAARATEVDDPSPLALQGLVPHLSSLDDYLALVSELLSRKTQEQLASSTRLPEDVVPLFGPLVLATAWKESCWRHYLNEDVPPDVIRSSIGAVGMMQINGRVWRGIYDLERLEREIDYNAGVGIEILEHYLVHYALRRGEHLQPGGLENLPRATYAAYNGGPRHLSRYRREETSARLKAIDQIFWRHFEQFRAEGWPKVSSCYPGGR